MLLKVQLVGDEKKSEDGRASSQYNSGKIWLRLIQYSIEGLDISLTSKRRIYVFFLFQISSIQRLTLNCMLTVDPNFLAQSMTLNRSSKERIIR